MQHEVGCQIKTFAETEVAFPDLRIAQPTQSTEGLPVVSPSVEIRAAAEHIKVAERTEIEHRRTGHGDAVHPPVLAIDHCSHWQGRIVEQPRGVVFLIILIDSGVLQG